MLTIIRAKKYKENFRSLREKTKQKELERLQLFVDDEFNEILNNHPLHGEYDGCRSINVTGDIRIVYKKVSEKVYLLVNIGTHNQLYE